MFKVRYVTGINADDEYINADNFSAYDELVNFYIERESTRPQWGENLNVRSDTLGYGEKAVRSEVVAAINKRFIFSITKVDGLPFTQGQTGDTGEDI